MRARAPTIDSNNKADYSKQTTTYPPLFVVYRCRFIAFDFCWSATLRTVWSVRRNVIATSRTLDKNHIFLLEFNHLLSWVQWFSYRHHYRKVKFCIMRNAPRPISAISEFEKGICVPVVEDSCSPLSPSKKTPVGSTGPLILTNWMTRWIIC